MNRRKRKRPLAPPIILAVFVLVLAAILGFRVAGAEAAQPEATPAQQMTGKLENPDAATVFIPAPTATPAVEQTTGEDEDAEAVEILAKLVYGEAGICSTTEQAAVVWCVLNRVDAGGGDIIAVATAPNQFYGYRPGNPVSADIEALVRDVLARWRAEDTCIGSVGRVLPEGYLWFTGDGKHNWFRNAYQGGDVWDWSLPSPYEEGWIWTD